MGAWAKSGQHPNVSPSDLFCGLHISTAVRELATLLAVLDLDVGPAFTPGPLLSNL